MCFKEILLPNFLYNPQSSPTPNVPLSLRIPCSCVEAKYKIKVAHS